MFHHQFTFHPFDWKRLGPGKDLRYRWGVVRQKVLNILQVGGDRSQQLQHQGPQRGKPLGALLKMLEEMPTEP